MKGQRLSIIVPVPTTPLEETKALSYETPLSYHALPIEFLAIGQRFRTHLPQPSSVSLHPELLQEDKVVEPGRSAEVVSEGLDAAQQVRAAEVGDVADAPALKSQHFELDAGN